VVRSLAYALFFFFSPGKWWINSPSPPSRPPPTPPDMLLLCFVKVWFEPAVHFSASLVFLFVLTSSLLLVNTRMFTVRINCLKNICVYIENNQILNIFLMWALNVVFGFEIVLLFVLQVSFTSHLWQESSRWDRASLTWTRRTPKPERGRRPTKVCRLKRKLIIERFRVFRFFFHWYLFKWRR